jgi:Dual specificity phosphatase, catalytic domain
MWRGGYFAAPDAVEIVPGLHIGAEPGRRAGRALAKAGVTQAVDLRGDDVAPSPWPSNVTVLRFPLAEYEAPGVDPLDRLSKQVSVLIQEGEVVYIHCRAGVQRAPMVACAVLLQMGWSLPDAFQLVRRRRAIAALSDAQVAVLRELRKRVDGEVPSNVEEGAATTSSANRVSGEHTTGIQPDPLGKPAASY